MKEDARTAYGVWLRAAGLVLVVTALVAFITAFYSKKFHLETGPARWIWIDHPLDEKHPIAFFAVRDVDVPPDPPFVRLRVACDADWTLYLNGREIAGGTRAASTPLLELDLTEVARKGEENRLAVALRSATGVGGFLASIDYAPLRENDVVTDRSWRICRVWSEGVLNGSVTCDEQPRELGAPPFGRWNYPVPAIGRLNRAKGVEVVEPRSVEDTEIRRREIRILSGVAIESSSEVPARLFDFGPVEARGRIDLNHPGDEVGVVEVRYAGELDETRQLGDTVAFVFAPGESSVAEPVARKFRYMAVAHPEAAAAAMLEPDATLVAP
jgi:hypothetical protein